MDESPGKVGRRVVGACVEAVLIGTEQWTGAGSSRGLSSGLSRCLDGCGGGCPGRDLSGGMAEGRTLSPGLRVE